MTQAAPAQPRRKSRFARFVTFALLLLFMPIFAFGATVAATGTITVSVQEAGPDGVNLWIPVPALMADLAIFAAPMIMPDDALEGLEARHERLGGGLHVAARDRHPMAW